MTHGKGLWNCFKGCMEALWRTHTVAKKFVLILHEFQIRCGLPTTNNNCVPIFWYTKYTKVHFGIPKCTYIGCRYPMVPTPLGRYTIDNCVPTPILKFVTLRRVGMLQIVTFQPLPTFTGVNYNRSSVH